MLNAPMLHGDAICVPEERPRERYATSSLHIGFRTGVAMDITLAAEPNPLLSSKPGLIIRD